MAADLGAPIVETAARQAAQEREARKAWAQWMERAPAWWLDAYWAAHPKPWLDSRLSAADKRRVRYHNDTGYREYHIRLKPSRATQHRYPHFTGPRTPNLRA